MNKILSQHLRYEPEHRLYGAVINLSNEPTNSPFGFPDGSDRTYWQEVAAQQLDDRYERFGAAAANRLPDPPSDEDWLEYSVNGNRQPWEQKLNALTADCSALAIALTLTDDQGLQKSLVAHLDSLLELPSWCLPDHYSLPTTGERPTLPDPSQPVLDIAAGWIAGTIALVAHLVAHRLPQQLVCRAKAEVQRRVLLPWREQSAYWHGLEAPPNNWAPWIASNIVLATAFAEKDGDLRRNDLIACAELSDRFLAGYGADGACEEGPAYWWWASATCLETIIGLENTFGAELLTVAADDLRAQAAFIVDMHIGPSRYANFGDSSSAVPPQACWTLLANIERRLHDDRARDHARSMLDLAPHPHPDSLSNVPLRHVESIIRPREGAQQRLPKYARFAYYPSQQLFIARDSPSLTQGLTLFAKAGNNDVSHNHNDVGSFIVGVDGEPVLLDLGAATYDRDTFGEHTRYLSPATRSSWHNVPIVAGMEQLAGLEYAASEVSIAATADRKALGLTFDACYPAETKLQHLRRLITLVEHPNTEIEVLDHWVADQAIAISQVCVTNLEPQIDGDLVRIGPLALQFSPSTSFEFDELPIRDPKFTNDWGWPIHRLRATSPQSARGTAAIRIYRD